MIAEQHIVRKRIAFEKARAELLHAVEDYCPGPHKVVQHRDARPPWCPECGYTDTGYHFRDISVTFDTTNS